MYNWKDLKEYFKDSYRISQALQDVENNGMSPKFETVTLEGQIQAMDWDKDDMIFWSIICQSIYDFEKENGTPYRRDYNVREPEEKIWSAMQGGTDGG